MEGLQVFQNEEFGQIRTIMIESEPWFVGNEVAEALGYVDARSTVSRKVCKEDKRVVKMTTRSRGLQNTTIINESGLYTLIMGSKLKSAIKFQRWVTSEVLPALRKTGSYSVDSRNNEMTTDTLMLAELYKTVADHFKAVSALTETVALLAEQQNKMNAMLIEKDILSTKQIECKNEDNDISYNDWISEVYEILNDFEILTGVTTNEMLHIAYKRYQADYNLSLEHYKKQYCEKNIVNQNSVSTLYVIFKTSELRNDFVGFLEAFYEKTNKYVQEHKS